MKLRHIFLTIVLLAGGGGGLQNVHAQFTMPDASQNGSVSVPIPVVKAPVNIDVVNRTEAELRRKEQWRQRNDVDFRISATGIATHFNKSWMNNAQNSVSGEVSSYYYHTYNKGRITSIFKFDGIYGMNFLDDIWFKNQDMLKLYYLSSWKLREKGALRNWAYSFSAGFASQFSEGFKSRTEKVVWSNFMAPATVNVGVGLTYTSPGKKFPFIVTVNPVAGSGLFVLDNRIDDERRKGLGIPVPRDVDGKVIKHKIEGGSNLNVAFNRTFLFGEKQGMSLQYNTTFGSFYGWMTELAKHEVDSSDGAKNTILPTANWANSLIFNPVRFLALEFRAQMLYDRSQIDRVQMQYYLRVGITYRYKNR